MTGDIEGVDNGVIDGEVEGKTDGIDEGNVAIVFSDGGKGSDPFV